MSNTTSPFGLGAEYENKSDVKSIMIVGVGGQGTLLASRLLGNVIQQNGFDVKVSEVHGMSQRGGSVVTYVKFGSEVYSPVIERGRPIPSSHLKPSRRRATCPISKREASSLSTHSRSTPCR